MLPRPKGLPGSLQGGHPSVQSLGEADCSTRVSMRSPQRYCPTHASEGEMRPSGDVLRERHTRKRRPTPDLPRDRMGIRTFDPLNLHPRATPVSPCPRGGQAHRWTAFRRSSQPGRGLGAHPSIGGSIQGDRMARAGPDERGKTETPPRHRVPGRRLEERTRRAASSRKPERRIRAGNPRAQRTTARLWMSRFPRPSRATTK